MPRRSAPPLLYPSLGALLWVAAHSAAAATLTVSPDGPIRRIADAARLAKDGDTVLIRAGTYRHDVASWPQRSLTIRGVGGRPILDAAGEGAEGKAIWVLKDGHFRIDNIAFRGARVPDGNGAGIRLEHGRLDLSRCVFEDNQMGLLTSDDATVELNIRDSLFRRAPPQRKPLPHLLYAGQIRLLTVQGSRFEQGYEGHLVKSRARRSELKYNLLADGPGGQASYELDLPNGGVAVVVGNVIAQSAATRNRALVSYGAEGALWPENRLLLAHNTLITTGPQAAWFARAWRERLPADTQVVTRNNLTVGPGVFNLGLGGDHRGDTALTGPAPTPPDYALPAASPLRGRVAAAEQDGEGLPAAEFAWPVGTRPLAAPARWAPGAMQRHASGN
ncbi:MAG TPA: hypothetical protein PLL39_00455 [Rhodocyclaceae bacterium]|nr:hypothetical protein [Rhodocyclaceae bacterium]